MSDLINRHEAISIPVLPKEYRNYRTYNLDDAYDDGWHDALASVNELPSAERKGKWIVLDECRNDGIYCSVCHKKVLKMDYSNTMKWKNFNFCPNCGARMVTDEET